MTLTEMLEKKMPESPLEYHWSGVYTNTSEKSKEAFKDWLKDVGLPDYDTIGKGGVIFSATDSLRKLLILLIDEP